MASPPADQKLSLTATYSSPANVPFALNYDLQAPPSGTTNPTVPDKTRYLSDLRKATSSMQEQINKELTQRMEEDKAKDATRDGGTPGASGVDEAREEENYGEEAQGEDD